VSAPSALATGPYLRCSICPNACPRRQRFPRATNTRASLSREDSLSDLEKRMMYFTEDGEMSEDAIALNDAFEAEYDPAEYESKVSSLLGNACPAVESNLQSARTWDEAVQELGKGDHYLLILLDPASAIYSPREIFGWSFWCLLGVAILLFAMGMVVFATAVLRRLDSMPPRHYQNEGLISRFK
jgi:hypothetical protein